MKRGPKRLGGAVVAIAAVCAMSLPTSAAARDELPVPWTLSFGSGGDAGTPPPGANDFACKPTKRHPRPIVLVHGLAANQNVNWQTISPFLANRGFCVFSLTYGVVDGTKLGPYQPGGFERMEQSSIELKRFVNRVLKATAARKVDIVGHSEGSLMPNYYVKYRGGARKVRNYVGMTTLWAGTNLAAASALEELGRSFAGGTSPKLPILDDYCRSCREFIAGSAFIEKMNQGGLAAPGVTYTNIVTRNDELVVPYTSGLMSAGPRVTNVVVQDLCPLDQAEHLAVAFDPVTAGVIYRALDPRHAPEPPCVPVLPGVGAVGYSRS